MSELTFACLLVVLFVGGTGAFMFGLAKAFPADPDNPPPRVYGDHAVWAWKPWLAFAAAAAVVGTVSGLWDLARWAASW